MAITGSSAAWRARSRASRLVALVTICVALTSPAEAADTWTEVKGPHVTVLASGNIKDARRLAWQLEQVRAAIVLILPWARVDLDRPFVVFAVHNESRMRALLPQFFERSGDTKPVSVWSSGPEKHYLAIRSDITGQDTLNINPHAHAYFSYISLIMAASLEREMPIWFSRGLAGVLSNTIVRETELRIGAPIPWHLRYLREGPRLRIVDLVKIGASAGTTMDDLAQLDAMAWAFVHFLLFADNGARSAQINAFFKGVNSGTPADVAMTDAFGAVEQLEAPFLRYLNQSIFSFAKLPADASVRRDGFSERQVPAAEAASSLALFYAATARPVEARAAIAESREGGIAAPDSDLAEAVLLSREDKGGDAQAALRRAVAGGSRNAYAYYELARLEWDPKADDKALAEREALLVRATELNPRHAWAFAMLADVRSSRGAPGAMPAIAQAIRLMPGESDHRLTLARMLWRAGVRADALKEADSALTLATTDEARRRARELREAIEREKP